MLQNETARLRRGAIVLETALWEVLDRVQLTGAHYNEDIIHR
jgi:predicted kinase